MPGTVLKNVPLTKVSDGDTVKVRVEGKTETLRLACLDTEESFDGGSKPVTIGGKLASAWAKAFFDAEESGEVRGEILVDIEFDTDDPFETCRTKHRGNYGRLICYVYRDGVNYNLRAVETGWSPYFVKYGRSRLHHRAFEEAEAVAQASGRGIWDSTINAGGACRDYEVLVPWWRLRDTVVHDYRLAGGSACALSVRLDYEEIRDAASARREITVLCDLQSGVNKWPGDGALIYAGSKTHRFNLWIQDRDAAKAQEILRLIETRYAENGRGYVYVSGEALMYPEHGERQTPEIILREAKQLSDFA